MLNYHFFARNLQPFILKFDPILVDVYNIFRSHCQNVPISDVLDQLISSQGVCLGIQCEHVFICNLTLNGVEILNRYNQITYLALVKVL